MTIEENNFPVPPDSPKAGTSSAGSSLSPKTEGNIPSPDAPEKPPSEEELLKSLGIKKPSGPPKPPPPASLGPLPGGGQKPNSSRLWFIVGISFLILVLLTLSFFLLKSWLGQRGSLEITFKPEGVDLVVDNRIKRNNVTKSFLSLTAGNHFLEASKEGYLTKKESFVIKRGEKGKLDVELKPIPSLIKLPVENVSYASLMYPGDGLLYFDESAGIFHEFKFKEKKDFTLFEGRKFKGVKQVVWSPVAESALVKLEGRPHLKNSFDNSQVRGQYVPLGENPVQGPPLYQGETTWLFDADRQTAAGWQPVKLSDNIRTVAWAADGSEIIYFYTAADGEHSLVRSWKDGSEWSRVVSNLNQFADLKINWGSLGRYLLAQSNDKFYLVDLVAKIFNEAMPDADLNFMPQWSRDGDSLAYVKKDNKTIGIWSATENKETEIRKLDFSVQAFTWRDASTLTVCDEGGNLWLVGDKIEPLPFVATGEIKNVKALYYSVSHPSLILQAGSYLYFLPL